MKTQRLLFVVAAVGLLALLTIVPAANAHVENNMPDSVAEMEYRIFLEFKPKDFATRVKLATVLLNQDKLAEAEQEFENALNLDPNNLQAHLGLSILRLKQGKTGEALEIIKKALEIAPDAPSVYLNYGKILEAHNRPEQAREMYQKGLNKTAGSPENSGTGHERQQLETALRNLQDNQDITPTN